LYIIIVYKNQDKKNSPNINLLILTSFMIVFLRIIVIH
jgi:hypothetical protein